MTLYNYFRQIDEKIEFFFKEKVLFVCIKKEVNLIAFWNECVSGEIHVNNQGRKNTRPNNRNS